MRLCHSRAVRSTQSLRVGCALLVSILLGCFLSGCGRSAAPPKAGEKLVVAVQNNIVVSPWMLAQQNRLFEKQGLEVEIKPYPSGKLALAAMLAGDADMATCADIPIAIECFRQPNLAIVATFASTREGAWVTARGDRGIRSTSDLAGKNIGTQRGSAVHFFLSMLLLHEGIPDDNVTITFMKAVDLPRALAQGRIDAFSMRNPFSRQAVELLGDNAVEIHAPSVYSPGFHLVTTQSIASSRKTSVVSCLRALLQAEEMIARNPQRACRDAVAGFGTNREEEIRQDWDLVRFRLSLEQSLLLAFECQTQWALDHELVPPAPLPDLLSLFAPEALRAVKPNAVTVICGRETE